jgi:phosphoribosylformylglycinamidine synthase subunit PurQ / glutaminase
VRFVHRPVYLRVEKNDTTFTNAYQKGQVLKMPAAHGDGCYYNTPEEIKKLETDNQILFRFCDREGNVSDSANPNGSLNSIAGIVNSAGNVMGLMPHPDRAAESILGSGDGAGIFRSMVARFAGMVVA